MCILVDLLSWTVVGLTALVGLAVVVDTLRLGAPPMPSSAAARQALIALLPTKPDLHAHELGAGWGGLAIAVARARPSWRVVAWEAAWVPWAFCAVRARLAGPGNLQVRRGDFNQAPFAEIDVVTCYLLTDTMDSLRQTLEEGGRPRGWLLSVGFGVRGWTPDRSTVLGDAHRTHIYSYRLPV